MINANVFNALGQWVQIFPALLVLPPSEQKCGWTRTRWRNSEWRTSHNMKIKKRLF